MSGATYLARRLALALVSLALLLGAVEIGMRTMSQRPPAASSYDRPIVYGAMDYERLNPWGQHHTNTLRVAVIGDSFTLGSGVQPYDTYGFRLRYLLNVNRQAPPAEVRIFAEPGSSTSMQLRFLGKALEWSPDIVILGIVPNDTEDWSGDKAFLRWRQEAQPREASPALQAALRSSRLAAWIHSKWDGIRVTRATQAYYRRLFDPQYSGWIRFGRALTMFRDSCAREHAAFVAVLLPLLENDMRESRYPYAYISARMREELDRQGIAHLDLLPVFINKSGLRLQAHPGHDAHPSEIAHRMIAEHILQFLVHQAVIDPRYAPDRSLTSDVDYFRGMMQP